MKSLLMGFTYPLMLLRAGAGEGRPQSTPKKDQTQQWKTKADGLFAVVCGRLLILGRGCSDLVQMHVPQSHTLGGIVFN